MRKLQALFILLFSTRFILLRVEKNYNVQVISNQGKVRTYDSVVKAEVKLKDHLNVSLDHPDFDSDLQAEMNQMEVERILKA